MSEDKFIFSAKAKRNLLITAIAGVLLIVVGILLLQSGGHGHEGGSEESSHAFHWINRLYTNLWLNNVYFVGLAVAGVFFVAFNNASQSGWSAYIKRLPEAFGNWIPYAGILMLGLFFITNKTAGHFHIFHWLDHTLYPQFLENGSPNPNYDNIIAGKEGYLNEIFFLIRMVVYLLLWWLMWKLMRTNSLKEDIEGGSHYWLKMRNISALFLVIYAVTSSTSAWDWVLSIDTHWFSTMFGWYNFASEFVGALAMITLMLMYLHDYGYFPQLNSSHLHDLGKYIFAFSIFWAYIWFSQFMLIFYANIPEETVYFVERLKSPNYAWIFYLNIFINFGFPFLFLMTRDAKRRKIFLKMVCVVLIIGHWFDFYLMVTPGVIGENGGVGFMEIGVFLLFFAGFLTVLLKGLTKAPLVARNHPMLQESLHHHI